MIKVNSDYKITDKSFSVDYEKKNVAVKLQEPATCSMLLVLTCDNKQFVTALISNDDCIYKNTVDIPAIVATAKDVTVRLDMSFGAEVVSTNEIPVIVNRETFKGKAKISNELLELHRQIAELRTETIKKLSKLDLTSIIPSGEDIRKGMVLTAIDDDGTAKFIYPFVNCITKVNGKEGESREVTLDASDIKLKNSELTVDDMLIMCNSVLQKSLKTIEAFANIISAQQEVLARLSIDMLDMQNIII